ncbi:MAG TPA: glycine cleavage system aminomethyltransferase GcvT [Cyclobacteriaceae bacterium]|jgi:aminomethyltransferase
MEIKKITLNDVHESLGAKMVPFAGFNMPVRYSSDIEEHMQVRNGVGIFDVSHMGEFFLRGPGALDLIQKISSNDATKLFPGRAQYSCLPNKIGGIVDDLIIYMLKENEYMLVVNASNIEKDWDWISSCNDSGVDMENASDKISLFAIQGPKAIEALQPLSSVDLSAIKFYHFEIGDFAGIQDVIISGTGYTGSGGFEIYVKNEDALHTWNKVMETAAPFGIKPIGLGARDTLRLEKGYCLYGNDIDDTTSPLEAGLGWVTRFTKEFINSGNLKEQKEKGVEKKLAGFQMTDRGIPRHGYLIKSEDGNTIGHVTSGTQSPMLAVGIGMGYVKDDYSKPGSIIFIEIRNKLLKAEVKSLPFV